MESPVKISPLADVRARSLPSRLSICRHASLRRALGPRAGSLGNLVAPDRIS